MIHQLNRYESLYNGSGQRHRTRDSQHLPRHDKVVNINTMNLKCKERGNAQKSRARNVESASRHLQLWLP